MQEDHQQVCGRGNVPSEADHRAWQSRRQAQSTRKRGRQTLIYMAELPPESSSSRFTCTAHRITLRLDDEALSTHEHCPTIKPLNIPAPAVTLLSHVSRRLLAAEKTWTEAETEEPPNKPDAEQRLFIIPHDSCDMLPLALPYPRAANLMVLRKESYGHGPPKSLLHGLSGIRLIVNSADYDSRHHCSAFHSCARGECKIAGRGIIGRPRLHASGCNPL